MIEKIATIICMLFTSGCREDAKPHPECVPDAPEVPGIYTKQLGSVIIDGENCKIFETYEKYGCSDQMTWWGGECYYKCGWKILTRITKCPSQNTTNSVTQSGGKFSHEIIN